MDNRDFTEGLINIDIPGITEAVVEVFGEQNRDKIAERIANITFFYRGTNKTVHNFIDQALINLESEDFSELPISKVIERRTFLKQAKSEIEDKIWKQHTLEQDYYRTEDDVVKQCYDQIPPEILQDIQKELGYFLRCNGTNEVYEYYFKKFAPYFGNPSTIEELRQNADFRVILEHLGKINETRSAYNKEDARLIPTQYHGIQQIKGVGIQEAQTEGDIRKRYFSISSCILSEASALLETGLDGKMKTLIGINLDETTCDRNVFHEIIHAVCAFEKDGEYRTGFVNVSNIEQNRAMNEVWADWLALRVLDKYLSKNPPMISSKTLESNYSRCFDDASIFLHENEGAVIRSLMSDEPLAFRDKIGAANFDKVDEIFSKIINKEEISNKEREFLDSDFVAE